VDGTDQHASGPTTKSQETQQCPLRVEGALLTTNGCSSDTCDTARTAATVQL